MCFHTFLDSAVGLLCAMWLWVLKRYQENNCAATIDVSDDVIPMMGMCLLELFIPTIGDDRLLVIPSLKVHFCISCIHYW